MVLNSFVHPQYEYSIMIEIVGVHSDNVQDPPVVNVLGETIEATTPVEALNELGAKGWAVHTTTASPFGDEADSALVFIILGRPVTND